MNEIDLKPCPFCGAGGDFLMFEHLEGTILHPAYQVRRDNCGASSGYTDKCCREVWNTRAALTPPEGYVLVPVEPTEAMLAAGYGIGDGYPVDPDLYRAMLAARPEVSP